MNKTLFIILIIFTVVVGIFVWKRFSAKLYLPSENTSINHASTSGTIKNTNETNDVQNENSYQGKVTKCLNDYLQILVPIKEDPHTIGLQNRTFLPWENKNNALKCFNLIPVGKKYYGILQYYGPITDEDKALVSSSIIDLLDYIPNFAFAARFSHDSLKNVEALKVIRWIGVIPDEAKVQRELWQGKNQKNWTVDSNDMLIVNLRFFNGTSTAERENVIKLDQGIILSNSKEYYRIKIKLENIKTMAAENIIAWIEPYVQPTIN